MDGRTDGRTDWNIHRAAWSQLKTIGNHLYATSSSVHHFIAIGELRLELQSGNAQFGGTTEDFFVPCDVEIWRMTLKNNRAPLQCCINLCASFHSHRCIQTGGTVQKRSTQVKIGNFLSRVIWRMTLKNDRAPLLCFVHHFVAIGEFKLELQSGNSQFLWK